jgi:conjugal transfer pilus assembly protein TraW
MKARRVLVLLGGVSLAAGWPLAQQLIAADYGQMGQTFPIIEADLLAVIAGKLSALETSGGIAALQRQMQDQAVASVRRPRPVAGISPASVKREWLFDPSVVLDDDLIDTKGNLIAARGTRANPLDHVGLAQALVFIDGNDSAQIDWAMRQWSAGSAKIVFVAGSPFDAMGPRQRRFYFDQGGTLTQRFGIRHTPAVVSGVVQSAEGARLKVAEVPLPPRSPKTGEPAT